MFDRNRFSEMRRRAVRGAMQSFFRASDTRLDQTENLQRTEIHRILVCRPNHRLGNLLLLTPLILELQRAFPNAEIDIVLAGDHGAELFRAFRNVGHIYELSRRMVRHPIALARIALQIRRRHYDLAIDPCEASQSSRLLVAMARAKHVIGVPRDRSAAGRRTMDRAPKHMAQWPVHLVRSALARRSPDLSHDCPTLDIQLSASERDNARKVLSELLDLAGKPQPIVVIGLFAEATGAKRYDKEWWQCFVKELLGRHPGYAFLEIAPPDGRSRLELGLPVFSSSSPRQVAAVISNLTCFVSADCGVMHLASASGIPTIGLFSVTDVSKYEPYGNGSGAIDTNGKSPEEVARLANGILETACVNHSSFDLLDRAARQPNLQRQSMTSSAESCPACGTETRSRA